MAENFTVSVLRATAVSRTPHEHTLASEAFSTERKIPPARERKQAVGDRDVRVSGRRTMMWGSGLNVIPAFARR